MNSILLELHFCPCVQYLSKLVQYPTIYIEQQENYSKGNYRNRCYISGSQGKKLLSIPLRKGKNQQQPIDKVQIANEDNWAISFWRSISTAYGNAPFFEHYADALKDIILNPPPTLFEYNRQLLSFFIRQMHIDTQLEFTTIYQKTTDANTLDFRNGIHPKAHRQWADPNFNPAKYAQVFEEKTGFIANLSAIDLLFCTGPQSLHYLEQSIQ